MNAKQSIAVAELAVYLSRLSPDAGAFRCADLASKLTALERRCQRFAERQCNEDLGDARISSGLSSLRKRVTAALSHLFPVGTDGKIMIRGAALRFDVCGDPRGCCLKLYHPELPKNGFGQDAYCVGA